MVGRCRTVDESVVAAWARSVMNKLGSSKALDGEAWDLDQILWPHYTRPWDAARAWRVYCAVLDTVGTAQPSLLVSLRIPLKQSNVLCTTVENLVVSEMNEHRPPSIGLSKLAQTVRSGDEFYMRTLGSDVKLFDGWSNRVHVGATYECRRTDEAVRLDEPYDRYVVFEAGRALGDERRPGQPGRGALI